MYATSTSLPVMFSTTGAVMLSKDVRAEVTCMPNPGNTSPLGRMDTTVPAVIGAPAVNCMPRFCKDKRTHKGTQAATQAQLPQ
jgi:hypothetical protein